MVSLGKKKKSISKKPFFPYRDTLTISIINSLTSILAGFVIFSAFGYMSYLQGIPVSNLAVDGKKTSCHYEQLNYNVILLLIIVNVF